MGYKDDREGIGTLQIATGDNYIRILTPEGPINVVEHWGKDTEGKMHRVVCPGGWKRNNPPISPKVCPICAAIAEVGEDDCGWSVSKRVYIAAETITKTKRKFKIKGTDKTVEKNAFESTGRVKLLGGKNGIPAGLYDKIAAVIGRDTYCEAPWTVVLEINRKGTGFHDTEYVSILPMTERDGHYLLKPVEELKDPDGLLKDGLLGFGEPTPIEQINEWVFGSGGAEEKLEGEAGKDEAPTATDEESAGVLDLDDESGEKEESLDLDD